MFVSEASSKYLTVKIIEDHLKATWPAHQSSDFKVEVCDPISHSSDSTIVDNFVESEEDF